MTEYVWHSPGGLYNIPDDFLHSFLADFPSYRIRWSLQDTAWHLEQQVGAASLPPTRIDPYNDDLIRAVDGFWRVMVLQPGDRMPCPGIINKLSNQRCGWSIKVPFRKTAETSCPICRSKGRDGRTMAAFYPFDEILLDHLRRTNPLTWGTVNEGFGPRTRAGAEADAANRRLIAAVEAKQHDASSLDYVDLRWLFNIPAAGMTRRQVDHKTFR